MATAGEWQIVRRRRRFPDNWKNLSEQPTPQTKPYRPYSHLPTYAQILTLAPPSPPANSPPKTTPTNSPNSSRPSSPKTDTLYYTSPHSPTGLRFPPSPRFSEWKGRCFKCCMRGHTIANCRNQPKCGKCWKSGHTGNRCRKQFPNAEAKPYVPTPINEERAEPMFDELLTGSFPYTPPVMPANRPEEIMCYIDRDVDYFNEADKLQRAVIMQVKGLDMELDIDEVAELAMRTNLVRREEISIGVLTKARFIIHLP